MGLEKLYENQDGIGAEKHKEGYFMGEKRIKPAVIKIVKYFVERLEQDGVKVDKIAVFGSHFKGNAGVDSDIDLIIVSENFRRKNLFKRTDMVYKAYGDTVRKFTVAMDIIMETPEEFNSDFGVVVYAA